MHEEEILEIFLGLIIYYIFLDFIKSNECAKRWEMDIAELSSCIVLQFNVIAKENNINYIIFTEMP